MEHFSKCEECGFMVEQSSKFCPNCGLYKEIPSFWKRIFKKNKKRYHTDSYLSLEKRLSEEVSRLSQNIETIAERKSALKVRIQEAHQAGRESKALVDALDGIDSAENELNLLLSKHESLLMGIEVERQLNDLKVFAHTEKEEELIELEQQNKQQILSWSENYLVGVNGRKLTVWEMNGNRTPLIINLPLTHVHILAMKGKKIALAGANTIAFADLAQNASFLELNLKDSISCLDFGDDCIVAGTTEGDIYRISTFDLSITHKLGMAHPFGVKSIKVNSKGQIISCGASFISNYWVAGKTIVPFTKLEFAEVDWIGLNDDRVFVASNTALALVDVGLTKIIGRVNLPYAKILGIAPDGLRAIVSINGNLELVSPRSRRRLDLIKLDGVLATSDQGDIACSTKDSLKVYKFSQLGEIGRLNALVSKLNYYLQFARSKVPDNASLAVKTSDLADQLKNLVLEASKFVLTVIAGRSRQIESLPFESVEFELRRFFWDLEDIERLFIEAAKFSPAIEVGINRLHLLPTATLLKQVDRLLTEVEQLFVSVSDTESFQIAIKRLEYLESILLTFEKLGNELAGPFWGNPDRPKLIDAISRLRAEFPSLVDALVARSVSVTLGQIDRLESELGIDTLKRQRERLAGIGKGSILDEITSGGALGQDGEEVMRSSRMGKLEVTRRDLEAETQAYLETHKL